METGGWKLCFQRVTLNTLGGRGAGGFHGLRQRGDPCQLWREHVLASDLVDPHSLIVADFTGDGLPDICVIEMDFTDYPQMILFVNRGGGRFETHVVDEGAGSHDARLIHINDTLAIVGKPFTGKHLGEVHLWMLRRQHH